MRRLAGVALASLLLAGCATGPRQAALDTPGGIPTALPAPLGSFTPEIGSTAARLGEALGAVGFVLYPPTAAYRPSEPASLTQAPRAVMQASIPDTDQGYVMVYQLADEAAAAAAGADLAAYLGSGFGQTNFPTDAQFSVARLGPTLVFTWWSRALATDATKDEAAFDAIRGVGEPIAVQK
jgi:hypothetical protein